MQLLLLLGLPLLLNSPQNKKQTANSRLLGNGEREIYLRHFDHMPQFGLALILARRRMLCPQQPSRYAECIDLFAHPRQFLFLRSQNIVRILHGEGHLTEFLECIA